MFHAGAVGEKVAVQNARADTEARGSKAYDATAANTAGCAKASKGLKRDYDTENSFTSLFLEQAYIKQWREEEMLLKKTVSCIILAMLLTSILVAAFNVPKAEATGAIYIRADGSIDPPTAAIQKDGDYYTLTDDINGSIIIERNNIVVDGNGFCVQGDATPSSRGISIGGKINVTIRNTLITSHDYGMYIYDSSECTLVGNNLTDNTSYGIRIHQSSGCTVADNDLRNCNYGIYIYDSSGCTLAENNLMNNLSGGVYLDASSYDIVISDNNSTGNHIGICLMNSVSCVSRGNYVSNNTYGIILERDGQWSEDNDIVDNILTGNTYAVLIDQSGPDNIVSGNTVTGSTYGVWLWSCHYNTISNNNLTGNGRGVYLYGSQRNVIAGNNVAENSYGLYLRRHVVFPDLKSKDNRIYGNNLIYNMAQVYIENPLMPNFWNDSYPSGGNYWGDYTGEDVYSGPYQNESGSDGIGDTPYLIDAWNIDNYPLFAATNGLILPWADDDRDGVLNYLDLPNFSFDESNAPSGNVLGSVSLPVKITYLRPSSDYDRMMEALHTWGVKEAPIRGLMWPIVVDISNVYGTLNWLRTHIPQLVSESFLDEARNSLCADGHWRSLWVIRADISLSEICKALLELDKFSRHPDLAFDAITRIINLFDLEIYLLKGTYSVTASLKFDFTSFSEWLASVRKYCKELFISVFEAIRIALWAIKTGGFVGVAWTLVAKLFNLMLDYFVFDYVQNHELNLLKVVLKAIDPPDNRVVLQLFDASGQTMLIGYDKASGEDVPTFEGGLYSADNDSAILMVARDNLDYNLTVTTTPTTTATMPHTLMLWDCTENDTIVTGGLIDANQSFSTRLNLTDNKLNMSHLLLNASLSNPNPQVGEQVEVKINVTDYQGTPYGDCDVVLSIANETILAQNQGNGFYNTTINTSGMAGSYNLTIFTRNPPLGFLQGTVTYPLEVGPHDIAVTNIGLSKSILGSGYMLTMNLTLQNNGFYAEAFRVIAYANASEIETTKATLASGNSTKVTFTWNTTGFAMGNYTISAYAEPVPGETTTGDNAHVGGIVMITIPGDVNGDRRVDATDLNDLKTAYGSTCGSPKWETNCDVNGDGKVEVLDLFLHGKNYEKTLP